MIEYRHLAIRTLIGDRSPGSFTFCLRNDPEYNIKDITEEDIRNSPDDVWYTEIQSGHPTFMQLIGRSGRDNSLISLYPELTSLLKETNGRVILNLCQEGFVASVIPELYNLVRMSGIPPHKIYYMSACSNLDELHKEYCEENQIAEADRIQVLDYYDWQIAFFDDLREKRPFVISTKPRKRFINLNRRVRRHRLELIASMSAENLLIDGYVSYYHDDDLGFTSEGFLTEIAQSEAPEYTKYITSGFEKLHGRPLVVDVFNSHQNPVSTDIFPYEEYRSADIELVSETFFHEEETFLSEKSFRPICFKKPFILVASAGTLQILRELGFRTFHPFIDERYDECEDDNQRMAMVIDELKKLVALDDFEMNTLLRKMNKCVAHNYQHLMDNWNWLRNRCNGDPLYEQFKDDLNMKTKAPEFNIDRLESPNIDEATALIIEHEQKTLSIGFVGVGKLGQPCAEVMAEKHFVEGYDIEPTYPENFKMVPSIKEVVAGKDIIFIAVPTPHDEAYDGSYPTNHLPPKDFDYSIVTKLLKEINTYAKTNQLVVLISTVLPGTTRREFRHLITNARFIYNPYLIAMGSVAWDMVNPEMVIIGTEDGSRTGDAEELISFYRTILAPKTRYEIGTWDEAEGIKIFYNTFISTKIALVNMIQDVAMKLGNIDVDVITNALSLSSHRITSSKFMTAGMGDGGACHPRDNIALRWMAEDLDLGYDLFGSVMDIRDKQAKNMAEFLLQFHLPVVIVGKAYKPAVPYIIGSPSVLVGSFIEGTQDVYYYDPLTGDYPPEDLDCAVFLLAHNHDVTYNDMEGVERTAFNLDQYLSCDSIVVDPWRTYTNTDGVRVIHYGNTRP